MHSLIGELPDREMPAVIGTPFLFQGNEQRLHECREPHPHGSMVDNHGESRRNRPVVAGTWQPDTAVSKPVSQQTVKRMKPLEKKARVQEALLYYAANKPGNKDLTQEAVAVQHGLEPKALSREYANKLKKAVSHRRDKTPKDMADEFLYNEKRRRK
jgi:hypothetical protein